MIKQLLCVDIGNTGIEAGWVRESVQSGPPPVESLGEFPTREFLAHPAILHHLLQQMGEEGIAFASVVPAATRLLLDYLAESFPLRPVFRLTHENCGVPLLVEQPHTVGHDRLAAMAAVAAYHRLPAIVIDMGTAVTCDLVTEAGYEGGIIAPGIGIMASYLHEKTAQLPLLDAAHLETPEGLGRTTLDQMKIGCAIGFAGMITHFLQHAKGVLARDGSTPASVIATGGTVRFLPPGLRAKMIHEEHLVLQGIGTAWKRQKNAGFCHTLATNR